MKKSFLIVIIILTGFYAKAQKPLIDTSKIYNEVDKLPEFPGGVKAFKEFINQNLKWPDPQIDAQGKVLVSFVIEKNGGLTHFKIQKKLQEKFDTEALRVVKLSPKWIPARINGKAVRSKYTVPINFSLSE